MESPAIGFGHFLAHTDAIGRALLIILLLMSVITWYLIVSKSLQALILKRRAARLPESFWDAPSLEAVAAHLEEQHPDEPFSHLAWHAIVATRHHQRHGANKLNESGTRAEFLTRAMRRVIDEETARFESGLTVLASIGSTAPFVGLFGTVWGVYHALVAIGMSGQGTLDKVAGPVGEALIMTALGLAVAIPAVLAYNSLGALEPHGARAARLLRARSLRRPHDRFARQPNRTPSCRCKVAAAGARGGVNGFRRLRDAGDGAPMAEINMIPLIDVMLVLLVIFIITAPLLTHAVKIDLPKASSQPNRRSRITSSSASVRTAKSSGMAKRSTRATLEERVPGRVRLDPQPELHLRADRKPSTRYVAEVMSMAARAGLRDRLRDRPVRADP